MICWLSTGMVGPNIRALDPSFRMLNAPGHKYDQIPGDFKKKKGNGSPGGEIYHGSFQN